MELNGTRSHVRVKTFDCGRAFAIAAKGIKAFLPTPSTQGTWLHHSVGGATTVREKAAQSARITKTLYHDSHKLLPKGNLKLTGAREMNLHCPPRSMSVEQYFDA